MGDFIPFDPRTGEISSEHYVKSKKQDDGYRKYMEKIRYMEGTKERHWVASYHDPIRDVVKDMSLTEAGAVIKLLPYLRFKSEGKLIKNGKPLKQGDIQRIFKRTKPATIDIVNRLKELGVISISKEGRSNVFYISANFHGMGSIRKGERFTKLYQEKTKDIVDDLSLNEVGLLYKIIPYFHYSEYYLVDNPNEKDIEKLSFISRERLAELIGHDEKTVTQSVSKLRSKGAILSTHSGKTVRYLVHPDVMFRSARETEWTQSVRKLFDKHKR